MGRVLANSDTVGGDRNERVSSIRSSTGVQSGRWSAELDVRRDLREMSSVLISGLCERAAAPSDTSVALYLPHIVTVV